MMMGLRGTIEDVDGPRTKGLLWAGFNTTTVDAIAKLKSDRATVKRRKTAEAIFDRNSDRMTRPRCDITFHDIRDEFWSKLGESFYPPMNFQVDADDLMVDGLSSPLSDS